MCYGFAMAKFFARNIDGKGRRVRAVAGGVMLMGGVVALFFMLWLALVLLALGVFSVIEALRGWCFLRACGIKTRH